MSLDFLEGFDNWASGADGTGVGWTAITGSAGLVTGRYAGQALGSGGGGSYSLRRSLVSPNATVTLGAALEIIDTGVNGVIAGFYSGGVLQGSLSLNASGTGVLTVTDATGSSHAVSGYAFPGTSTWTYLEMQMVGSTTSGTITVKQNGTTIGAVTGVATFTSGVVHYDAVAVGTTGASLARGNWDDLYCTNGGGSGNTGFLGPLRVCSIYPSADVAPLAWTPSSGTTLYNLVNEAVENGGTTTISASANSLTALFDVSAVPTGLGQIFGVQVKFNGQNTGNSAKTLIKSSGTLHTSPSGAFPAAYTNIVCDVVENDPATGTQWLTAGVNAMLIGIENGAP